MRDEPVHAIRKPRVSLRLKLTVGLILIIGVVFAGANAFNIMSHRKAQRAQAHSNRDTVGWVLVTALTGQLADHELDSGPVRNFVRNFLRNAMKANPDLAFGVVVDTRGQVIAGNAKPAITVFPGNRRYQNVDRVLAEIARLDGKLGGHMKRRGFNLEIAESGKVAGKFLVGTSMARLEKRFQRDLIVNISVLVGTLLLLVIYVALTLGRMVVRPISQVMLAMRSVHNGDFDNRLELESNDEIGVLADTYNFMVRGLKEREQLKDAFSRYVSTQVYDKLKLGELKLTGEMRNATVLFSDIRSFTALSERLAPDDVVRMLNDYFNVMVDVVFKYDGFVNKFIGDALMAVYNVPIDQKAPELRAVRTALEMVQELERFNRDRAKRGLFGIKIGVGINTGPVIAGNIGHLKRLEYTVIGDTVNLAQRIESQTKVTGMPILISQTTYQAVEKYVVGQSLPPVKVKGKQEPVALYAITELRDRNGSRKRAQPIHVPSQTELRVADRDPK
jgi:class 3 adenylate cyclase